MDLPTEQRIWKDLFFSLIDAHVNDIQITLDNTDKGVYSLKEILDSKFNDLDEILVIDDVAEFWLRTFFQFLPHEKDNVDWILKSTNTATKHYINCYYSHKLPTLT